MPNRIIKESILTSDSFNALTLSAQSFFIRLIVRVDDFGRFEARSAVLRAALYPLRLEKVDEKCVIAMLEELKSQNMVSVYWVLGKPYLQMVNWNKYQQLRAKKSKYPAMSESDSTCNQEISSDGTCNQTVSGDHSCDQIPSESESESESFLAGSPSASPADKPKRSVKLVDAEYLAEMKKGFPEIDVDAEYLKLKAWLKSPKGSGKQDTQQRFFNWLSRATPRQQSLSPSPQEPKTPPNYVLRVDPC